MQFIPSKSRSPRMFGGLAKIAAILLFQMLIFSAWGQTVFTLTVRSSNPSSGVSIGVTPADNSNRTDGVTTFTRNYNSSTQVTLTAPTSFNGANLLYWVLDGTNQTDGQNVLALTMDASHTATAVYQAPYLLTVQSQNPNFGVSINATPADRNGSTSGSTSFNLSYLPGVAVTLTAPATASGNVFKNWRLDGVDETAGETDLSVTMDGPHTALAVYSSIYQLTVQSQNPNSGVTVTATPTDRNGATSGSTQFSLSYVSGTVATLSAPATAGGNSFNYWLLDGQAQSPNQQQIAVTMNGPHTATAVYTAVFTLTVQSQTPNSGIAIDAVPADRAGNVGGTTAFTLNYNSGTTVTLTAPLTSGNNGFVRWNLDTVDQPIGTQGLSMSMSQAHTAIAVYAPVDILTVQSQNPPSGVAIVANPTDNYGTAGGSTNFSLIYQPGTAVTLTAPATAPNGNTFLNWLLDGNVVAGTQLHVTMSTPHTAIARYLGLQSLRVLPDNVLGGTSTSATVAINGPAGPSGFGPISLGSSDSTVAFPAVSSISIQPTFTRVKFTVKTNVVFVTKTAMITASYNGTTLQWMVTATPTQVQLTFTPLKVVGGNPVTLGVILNPIPTAATSVPLSASNTAPLPNFPASVPVAANSATGTVQFATDGVDATTVDNITAGATTMPLTIAPATMRSFNFTLSSVQGGSPAIGQIHLNGKPGPSGYLVDISSNSALASVPASVTVPHTATGKSFAIQTALVAFTSSAVITVSHGSVSKQATLTITPLLLSAFTIAPNPVSGGKFCTATVTLSAVAAAAAQVAIRHTYSGLVMTTPITVAAGASTGTQRFQTPAVAASVTSTVTATFNGKSLVVKLVMNPSVLTKISVSPASIKGGLSTTGTVFLDALAPATGASIVVRSSNTAVAVVPLTVVIPGGKQFQAFTITTKKVTVNTTVTLSATYSRGGSATTTLTVTP